MCAPVFITRAGSQIGTLFVLWIFWIAARSCVRCRPHAPARGLLTPIQIAATGITTIDCIDIIAGMS
jgi:hypothetical protein